MADLPQHLFVVQPVHFHIAAVTDVYRMPAAHTHGHVEINYVLTGRLTYLFNGRTAPLDAGDFGLFWAAIPHQTTVVEEGSRYVCVYVPLDMMLALPLSEALRSALLAGAFVAASAPERFSREQMLRIQVDGAAEADARMEDLLVSEVGLLLRRLDVTGWHDRLSPAPHPPRGEAAVARLHEAVVRMARFIADHGHSAIGVREVARSAGVHPGYAMTVFRRTLGLTINQYLVRHRLMVAQALLVTTRKDVGSIAFDSGFGSLSRFHEAFRQQFGCTPRTFRRTALGAAV